ncbi:MAG: DUF3472 domain-containing protein [Planctomycetota bacterium]
MRHLDSFRFLFTVILSTGIGTVFANEVTVPAFTAYTNPVGANVRFSDRGVSRWSDPEVKLIWFGQFSKPDNVTVQVAVRESRRSGSTNPIGLKFRMTVGDRSAEASVIEANGQSLKLDFGEFKISEAGYQSFTLESLEVHPGCDIDSLILEGDTVEDAHFNVKPRRNSASVHLFYPLPEKDLEVDAFYCEMTGIEDPLWTYYMACGWHRGYFGMQVNSPTERRIIFSVWDSGNEAIDRDKVADENRVTLVDKGKDVYSGSFGNEGTGGHSHLKYPWKTGELQRFLVTAKPVDKTHTIFSGYYFHPDNKDWMLISSWKAPKEGKYLRGLYSFSENFVGRGGHQQRKALYGNQWIRASDGQWTELTQAGFSHDATGKADRRDRFGGTEEGQFFLSHGGYIDGFTEYGKRFTRPKTNQPPSDLPLP